LIATAIWLPLLHIFFRPGPDDLKSSHGIPTQARWMANYQLSWLQQNAQRGREAMRRVNPEWDLMGRTFFVLALANIALREPGNVAQHLATIDLLIDETLRDERERGHLHFLMPYARHKLWMQQPQRSQFVDSELAIMLAARRMLADSPNYRDDVRQRIALMMERMEQSPILCAESYPDECWLFDNTMALAAIRLTDVRDGTDHSAFTQRWLQTARERLIDAKSGLLLSSFTLRGDPRDGPEGSSIWMAAHLLQLLDADFAAEQYGRAKQELSRSILGFGYTAEWPSAWRSAADVDSGPSIPGLDISAGSTGLALVAARAFGDIESLRDMLTTLRFAGFPLRRDETLRYAASNPVGDAVMLYSLVLGPLWEKSGPNQVIETHGAARLAPPAASQHAVEGQP
jgi:hypothetical protein